MIEDALVFALGALVAGLLALVLFPAFTRRAARLARREVEASLPRSLSEIAAARDAVRAVYAAKAAKVETDLETARAALAAERLARAAGAAELSAAQSEIHGLKLDVAEADARTEAVRAELRQREEALARSAADRRDLERRHHAETERRRAAEERAEEVAAIATEMRLALAASEARVVSLEEALKTAAPAVPAVVGTPDPVVPGGAEDAIDAEWVPAAPAVVTASPTRPAEPAPAVVPPPNRRGDVAKSSSTAAREPSGAAREQPRVPTVRVDPDAGRTGGEPPLAARRPAPAARVSRRYAGRKAPVEPSLGTWPTVESPRGSAPEVRPPTGADAAAFGLEAPVERVSAPLFESSPASQDDRPEPVFDLGPSPAAAFPALPAPEVAPVTETADPVERSRRVDNLARRLKDLRTRNAASRGRGDPVVPEEAAPPAGPGDSD